MLDEHHAGKLDVIVCLKQAHWPTPVTAKYITMTIIKITLIIIISVPNVSPSFSSS